MDLRKAFFESLIELASKDKDVIFLTGDLGFNFVEQYAKQYPSQFINAGCIEQSMVDIAVGLALSGKKPYVYSVINFLIFRAYEIVRNDVADENTNVKLIGVRGQEAYTFLGISHNLLQVPHFIGEDKKVLDHLPNIKLCFPSNAEELKEDMILSYKGKYPTYIRL